MSPSKSARSRTSFHEFFFQRPKDHSSAVSAVVAGAIAGGLMTAIFLVAFLGRVASQGWRFPNSAVLLGAAVSATCATYATWKHFVIGPMVALALGTSLVWWVAMDLHDPTSAIILAAPILGGPALAARGIVILNRLARSDVPPIPRASLARDDK